MYLPVLGDCISKTINVLVKSRSIGAKFWDAHHFPLIPDNFESKTLRDFNQIEDNFGDFNKLLALGECHGAFVESRSVNTEHSDMIYNIFKIGIKLLDSCSSKMNHLIIHKYANPKPNQSNSYEGSLRNNLTSTEKQILIRYLVMIQSLSQTISSFSFDTVSKLYTHIHQQIQNFTQINLLNYVTILTKKKKTFSNAAKYVLEILSGTRHDELLKLNTQANTHDSKELKNEPIPKFHIQILRITMNTILQEKNKSKGLFKDLDLKEEQYAEIMAFLPKLHDFEMILRFEGNLNV